MPRSPEPRRSPPPRWQPLLQGELRQGAEAALVALAEELRPRVGQGLSVAGGRAGMALFYAYLARTQADQGWAELALERLAQAMAGAETGCQSFHLFGGCPGIGWLLDHLQGWFLDPEDEDRNGELDEAILTLLRPSPWRESFDLVTGLAGLGQYGLGRCQRPGGQRVVAAVLDRLEELATPTGAGLAWFTGPDQLSELQRRRTPNGHWDLGLAHGLGGVIGFLGQACAAGLGRPKAIGLLEGALAWLACQRNVEEVGSWYPPQVLPEEPGRAAASRVAWCYGDLGLSLAVLTAGQGARRPDWVQGALAMARLAAERPLAVSGVREPSLCHGAAGNAHLFNRLYQASGEPAFAAAALRWFGWTLGFRNADTGQWDFGVPPASGPVEPREGLLMGKAGIGLALHGALTGVEPAWDSLLGFRLQPF